MVHLKKIIKDRITIDNSTKYIQELYVNSKDPKKPAGENPKQLVV